MGLRSPPENSGEQGTHETHQTEKTRATQGTQGTREPPRRKSSLVWLIRVKLALD